MQPYQKIPTMYKRGDDGKLCFGEYATREIGYLANKRWSFTEKVDGTNIRVLWDGQDVAFWGRQEQSQIPVELSIALSGLFKPVQFEDAFDDAIECVCLYGEGYGPKIQTGGGKYRPTQGFVLFDVWVDGYWLEEKNTRDVAEKMEIDHVPSVGFGRLWEAAEMVRSGMPSRWGNFMAEGIVARPIVPLCDRRGNRILTKIKRTDFDHE